METPKMTARRATSTAVNPRCRPSRWPSAAHNQASRYSHHLIAMRDGQILAQGTPTEVITEEVIASTFGINSLIIPDPVTGTSLCIPRTDLPNGVR
jgi:hypothetical protein